MKLTDREAEALWESFADVPFIENENKELILDAADGWAGFEKGTVREDIWQFFDENHSKGVRYLLYEYEPEELNCAGCVFTYFPEENLELLKKAIKEGSTDPGCLFGNIMAGDIDIEVCYDRADAPSQIRLDPFLGWERDGKSFWCEPESIHMSAKLMESLSYNDFKNFIDIYITDYLPSWEEERKREISSYMESARNKSRKHMKEHKHETGRSM